MPHRLAGLPRWVLREVPGGSRGRRPSSAAGAAACRTTARPHGGYIGNTGAALTPLPNATVTPRFAIRAGEGRRRPSARCSGWSNASTWHCGYGRNHRENSRGFPSADRVRHGERRQPVVRARDDLVKALTIDAVRQALARDLSAITQVPDGLPTHDLEELRSFLRHFGTYKPDGTVLREGQVAEGSFPTSVSPAYLAPDTGNVAKVRLQRDWFCCYALVPGASGLPQAGSTRGSGSSSMHRRSLAPMPAQTVAARAPAHGQCGRARCHAGVAVHLLLRGGRAGPRRAD